MSTYYWVGGTNTWDNTATGKWSNISGGSPYYTVPPTSSDDVIFDSNSGGSGIVVSIGSTIYAKSLTFKGVSPIGDFSGEFKNLASNTLTISGNLTLSAGMNYNNNGNVYMFGTSASTITSNGQTFKGNLLFGSATIKCLYTCTDKTVVLGSTYIDQGIVTFSGGTTGSMPSGPISISGYASYIPDLKTGFIYVGRNNTTSANKKIIADSIELTGYVYDPSSTLDGVWAPGITGTNGDAAHLDITQLNKLIITGDSGTSVYNYKLINPGGNTFKDYYVLTTGTGVSGTRINTASTFDNIYYACGTGVPMRFRGCTINKSLDFTYSTGSWDQGTITDTNYNLKGNLILSVGMSIVNTPPLTFITPTSTASYITSNGKTLNDTVTINGGNVYLVDNFSNSSSITLTSGTFKTTSSPSATCPGSNITCSQLILNGGTFSSCAGNTITTTHSTNGISSSITATIVANYIGVGLLSSSSTNNLTFDNNVTLTGPLSVSNGTLTISGILTTSSTLSVSGGTLDCANTVSSTSTATLTGGTLILRGNSTFSTFSSSGTIARTLFVPNPNKTLTLTGSGTAWNVSGSNTTSFTSLSSKVSSNLIIKITNTTSAAVTFAGGDMTYYTLWWNRINTAGDNIITGSNTFDTFKDGNVYIGGTPPVTPDNILSHNIKFTSLTTNSFTNFNVNGLSGKLITLTTVSGTTPYSFTKLGDTTAGAVKCYYLNVNYCNANQPDPTYYTWYAYSSSQTSSTGWALINYKYWVGGSGNWNDSAHWALETNGAGNKGVPSATDDVIFDINSGLSTAEITVNVAAFCKSITFRGTAGDFVGTFKGSSSMSILEGIVLSPSMTNNYDGTITFSGPGTYNITSNLISFKGSLTFSGTGTYNCTDYFKVVDVNPTSGANNVVTLTSGNLNFNGTNGPSCYAPLLGASCSGTTLYTTNYPALTVGMTIYSSSLVSLGTITGGSDNTWTVSIGGTYPSQNMNIYIGKYAATMGFFSSTGTITRKVSGGVVEINGQGPTLGSNTNAIVFTANTNTTTLTIDINDLVVTNTGANRKLIQAYPNAASKFKNVWFTGSGEFIGFLSNGFYVDNLYVYCQTSSSTTQVYLYSGTTTSASVIYGNLDFSNCSNTTTWNQTSGSGTIYIGGNFSSGSNISFTATQPLNFNSSNTSAIQNITWSGSNYYKSTITISTAGKVLVKNAILSSSSIILSSGTLELDPLYTYGSFLDCSALTLNTSTTFLTHVGQYIYTTTFTDNISNLNLSANLYSLGAFTLPSGSTLNMINGSAIYMYLSSNAAISTSASLTGDIWNATTITCNGTLNTNAINCTTFTLNSTGICNLVGYISVTNLNLNGGALNRDISPSVYYNISVSGTMNVNGGTYNLSVPIGYIMNLDLLNVYGGGILQLNSWTQLTGAVIIGNSTTSGTLSLYSKFETTSSITLTAGTLTCNYNVSGEDFHIKSTRFISSNTNIRVLNIASGAIWNITSSTSNTYTSPSWTTADTTNMTINAIGSIIKFSSTNNTSGQSFHGGYNLTYSINTTTNAVDSWSKNTPTSTYDINYGTLWFNRDATSSSVIFGSNKFDAILDGQINYDPNNPSTINEYSSIGTHTIYFEENRVQVVDDFRVNGKNASGVISKITLNSINISNTSTTNYHYLVNNNTDPFTCYNLDIRHSSATPNADYWYARSSVDGSPTTNPTIGWTLINNKYWVPGGNGNWNSSTNWSEISGGLSGASVPTSDSSAIFNGNSGSGNVIITSGASCFDFDCSDLETPGINSNVVFTLGSSSYTLTTYGDVKFGPCFSTYPSSSYFYIQANNIKNVIDGNSVSGIIANFLIYSTGTNGQISLSNNLATSGYVRMVGGNFNTKPYNTSPSYDLTCKSFYNTGNNITCVINLNSSLINLLGDGIVWDIRNQALNGAYTTLNAGTSTIKMTNSSNTALTFYGAGKTYNKVWFDRGSSTGSISAFAGIGATGGNTYNEFIDSGISAHTIYFSTTSNTFNIFNVNGSGLGNEITISTTSGYAPFTSTNTLKTYCSYVNVYNNHAVPSNKFYTGVGGTLYTNVSGWNDLGGSKSLSLLGVGN